MSNIEYRVILRNNYNGKASGSNDMAERYDSHMRNFTRICGKSLEAVTSQHISWCWKSYGILSPSDVDDLTQRYVNNNGKCSGRRSC